MMLRVWACVNVLQLLLTSFVFSFSVNGQATQRTVQPRQSVNQIGGLVSGVDWRDEHGNVPVRHEVRDLKANHTEHWNLYILALAALQWTDQNDTLSYYSLASIHGRPFRTWGNAPGIEHKIGKSGYCPHGNTLFMGWHRPYLALFEEQLYRHAQYYAIGTKWEELAKSFRMPYWDWAKGVDNGVVPDFFMTERINITWPNGSEGPIWNPLFSYSFHPLTPDVFDWKWARLNSTQRWPSSDSENSISNQTGMADSFIRQRRGLHDRVASAFQEDTVNNFANTIETVHGWVHGVIGGGWDGHSFQGHMWPLEYSAFEPLFMLHHTNVDRLLALYQSAHPDIYFTESNIGQNGNVFLENGATVSAETELLPFRKASGDFWTTNDARKTSTLGYAYPETIRSGNVSDEQHRSAAVAAIAQLYSSSARDILTNQAVPASGHALLESDGTFTDWAVELKVAASALSPNFIVRLFFVGLFSSDEVVDVGTWLKLVPSSHVHSVKHSSAVGTTYEGQISLTSNLLDQIAAGKLGSLDVKDVVPYLKEALDWKVLTADGDQLSPLQLAAIALEVVSRNAKIPNDPKQAIEYKRDIERHPEVTLGKAGGVTV